NHLRDGVFHDYINYWGVGHGSGDTYTVKYGKIFLRTPDISMHTMGNRVVHLLACSCGAKIIPDLVTRFGARVAIGYEEDFVIGRIREPEEEYSPRPCEEPSSDADCYTPSDCDLEIQRQLLRGASAENAVKASQAKFEREIERYEVGDRSDWYIAGDIARSLFHDMRVQVMYESKVGVPPSLWEKYGPGLAIGTFGVGAVMLGKPALEERGLL
ncbi:unnamed protein product, partial [marine sediment metagenome]